MATRPAQEDQRLKNDTDQSSLVHDFVYRPDMDVKELAQYLNKDWDDTYNWLNDQLEQAEMDDDE